MPPASAPTRSRFHLRPVPVQDELPLQLLRRRHQPVLRRPLLFRDDHSVDDFDASQASAFALGLQFLEDERLHLFVLGEGRGVRRRNAGRGGEGVEGWLGRDDDCDWLDARWRGVDADVGDEGGGAVERFELE